jgi:hypothetical protein
MATLAADHGPELVGRLVAGGDVRPWPLRLRQAAVDGEAVDGAAVRGSRLIGPLSVGHGSYWKLAAVGVTVNVSRIRVPIRHGIATGPVVPTESKLTPSVETS